MALPQITTPVGRIDLTKLDYYGIVDQIKNSIKTNQKYSSKFSSFFESDAGIMLIELFSQIAHMNNLRIDFMSNELSWLNAEQPETILNFLPLIDYRLPSVTGSTTNVNATVTNQPGGLSPSQILVPSKTKLSAVNLDGRESTCEILASPTNYTADIILAPNIKVYSLNVYAGITDFADVTVSKAENFTFKINQRNVINNSIQIFLNIGNNQYTQLEYVDSFITQLTSNPQFTVRFDFNGQPTIIFGNKYFGGVFDGIIDTNPSTYKSIRVYYRYLIDDTGESTNYAAGSIEDSLDFFSPAINDNITLAFFNTTSGFGGSNILTIDQVKQIAPLTIRTANKAVTNEDYEIFLSQHTLVKDVIAITPSEEPAFNVPIFHAYIYVAPNRINSDFLSTTTPVPDNKMPEPVIGETQSEYLTKFNQALSNFYNITGMETKAQIVSTVDDSTHPVVLNVNDRLRILVDSSDVISGFVDIKLQENLNKPIEDIVDEINSNFNFNVCFINSENKIVFTSNVYGTGSFIQLLGNFSNPLDDDILTETYTTLGFVSNQFAAGTGQTQEAAVLQNLIEDKKIIGIESTFKPIVILPFKISARVYYDRNTDPIALESTIKQTLVDTYSYQSAFLVNSIRSSNIGNTIQNVPGVVFVEMVDFVDIEPQLNQIAFILDDVIIKNMPSEYPDLQDLFSIDLTMIRNA